MAPFAKAAMAILAAQITTAAAAASAAKETATATANTTVIRTARKYNASCLFG